MSRRRFLYTLGGQPLPEPIEVGDDFTNTEARAPVPTEELVYGDARASDGTDISTRKKHREYLQRNGLSMLSDFKEHHAKLQAERAKAFTPGAGYDSRQRREDIGRALYQLETKGRRK